MHLLMPAKYGVHYDYIREAEGNTGHTIIRLTEMQNSILLLQEQMIC